MTELNYHIPVLAHACMEALAIRPDGVYVDVTFGGGGHSALILNALNENGRLIAFDQDKDAAKNVPNDPRVIFVAQNFRYLKKFLRLHQALPVDGILADFGVSSHQLDKASRGFTFRNNATLDMRMDQSNPFSAYQLVNEYEEDELSSIFKKYGELSNARQLARLICVARSRGPIETTFDLKNALAPHIPRLQEAKFLAKVFQAIRIEVNHEMEALEEFLLQTATCLKPGGRLVTLSYHSLEDRPVKNLLKTGNLEGIEHKDFYGNILRPFTPVSSKAAKAGADELEENKRARSARLRIGERNHE